MTAIITLRPEQRDVVLHGGLPDPHSRSWTSQADDEESADQVDESNLDLTLKRQRKGQLTFQLGSAWWSRYGAELTVLIAPAEPKRWAVDVGQRAADGGGELMTIAVARAEGGRRQGATGTRDVTIAEWKTLPRHVPLRALTARMPPRQASKVQEIAFGMSRPLPPSTDRAFRDALTAEFPSFASISRELMDPGKTQRPIDRDPRLVVRQDATTTALRIFVGPRWRSLEPIDEPIDPPLSVTSLVATLTERDSTIDDTNAFPGWQRSARSRAGWWEFRSGNRRLLVKSIDATYYEARAGADLVYMRRDPDAFVLVQYKLLKPSRGGSLVYHIDDRIEDQLRRMITICSPEHIPAVQVTPDQWRLGPGAAFVKFVEPTRAVQDDDLVPGYYVPAELVALDLAEQAARGQPRGALRVTDQRYLDPRTFARLVGDAWVGTGGESSEILRRLLLESRQRWRATDLTFAYDEPLAIA